jgi:serine/threonine-protein kinase
MEAERWRRVQDVMSTALALGPERRSTYLSTACAGDGALRIEVERLIELHPAAEEFLEEPPWALLDEALAERPPEPETLTPGTAVGRYVVLGPLGEGGMGAVYAARDPQLDRTVAIKLVRPFGPSPDRLLREAQALARISHPHVVTVYDVGTHGGGVFLALELLAGGTLEGWLQAAPRSWREILDAFLEAARGLAAAHRAGVVHRDFKPANVLRGADGHLRVADFGLARAAGRDEPGAAVAAAAAAPASTERALNAGRSTAAAMGTPSYMAPEQYLGAEVGPWTDQFAFAVALWEALCGEHPFQAGTVAALRERVLAGAVGPAPDRVRAPARLLAAVERGLAPQPGRRWGSMDELIAALERARARPGRRRAVAAALSALALAAALALVERPAPAEPRSVAVLPFVHLGPDPDAAYLSDGITEELIAALVGLEGLRVPARASVFALRDRGLDAAESGRRLGVAHVLEGTVRQDGGRLRVTAKLVAVPSGEPLWAETFERPLADLFAVQEEIARAIAGRLEVELAPAETLVRPATASLEAYGLYLRGRMHWNRRTPDGLRQAVDYFERAVTADPGYALAYSGLADAYSLMPAYAPEADPAAAIDKARTAALRALELAPDLAEAHASYGSVASLTGDLAAAETAFRRAIELDPRYATAHHWYGHLLVRLLDRPREAVAELELARRLDPASSPILAMLAGAYYRAGSHEEALAAELALRELDPEWTGGGSCISRNYIALRRYADAVAAVEAMGPAAERPLACWLGLAEAHHLAGDYAAELTAARAAREIEPDHPGSLLAETAALAALGRAGEAEALFERALGEHGIAGPAWYVLYSVLGELRVHGHAAAARELAARLADRYGAGPDAAPLPLPAAANLAVALLESGRTAEGAALLTAALGATAPAERLALGLTDAQAVGLEGWMAALAGRREEARGALRRLDALEPVSDLPPYSVIVRAALGERAAAVAALRERLRTGLVYGRDLHVHVGLDALRGDPGYVALASEFGLPVGSARAPAEAGAAPG